VAKVYLDLFSVHLWGLYSLYKRKYVAWEGVVILSADIPSCVRRGSLGAVARGVHVALVEVALKAEGVRASGLSSVALR